jgi:CarD family transcriptional regulator, regulator of rRNA transcription
VRLAVGDMVVYGAHGAGAVAARESRVFRGAPRDVIVLALAGGLRVELPVARAHECLRPLATEADVARVKETLSSDQPVNGDAWLTRQRAALAKLSSGEPVGLAEIIRDCAGREREQSTKSAKPVLSPSERDLLTQARRLLSTEIGLLRGIAPEEAEAWIDRQLERAAR